MCTKDFQIQTQMSLQIYTAWINEKLHLFSAGISAREVCLLQKTKLCDHDGPPPVDLWMNLQIITFIIPDECYFAFQLLLFIEQSLREWVQTTYGRSTNSCMLLQLDLCFHRDLGTNTELFPYWSGTLWRQSPFFKPCDLYSIKEEEKECSSSSSHLF